MGRRRAGVVVAGWAWAAGRAWAAPFCSSEAPDPPFDAAAAWDEARTELSTNYAYWDRIDADAVFDAVAPAMRASPDRPTFATRLQTLLLLFRDSHLHVRPLPDPQDAWVPSAADLWLEETDGRLVVRDVKGGSAAAAAGIRPGWELVSMDGEDLRDRAARRFAELGVTPDPAQRLYAANSLASGQLERPRRFVFRVGRRQRTVDLPPGYDSVARPEGSLAVTTTPDAAGHPVVFLRVANSLGDDALIGAFDQAVAALPAGAHVVVDLRDTPSGGNSTVARALMSHFVREPTPYQRHELTHDRVVYGVARRWVEYVDPRPPYVPGPLVALAGLWTGSMGEGLAIGFDAAGATVVGSPMGQLLGARIDDELPASCITVSFADEKLWHVDGTPREEFRPEELLATADTAPDGSDPARAHALALFDRWDAAAR